MNKKIQPKTHTVTFKCASCGSEYQIESTYKQDTVSIDVCSNCHPFYKSKSLNQKAKGRAEKLSEKFAAGMNTMKTKPAPKANQTKKTNKKTNLVKSLDDLK